ncbi:MAG: cyclic nucleotide-binding domain-containing protein [Deltaproteobacteria bacterium]|nr:cyclic nucleotide-binding domain-containing protein [Deltaproteobacteria bacterium]MCW5807855.1 cyclic nucleotide-binding domain-containing protein [Deltaproteobacteria bacterium]
MVSLGDVKRSAATLYAQGQHLAALRLYDAIVAAQPLDYDARLRVADCALALGDRGAAQVYRAVGWYCLKSGHPLPALVCARVLEAHGGEAGDLTAALVAHYGSASELLGKVAARISLPADELAIPIPDVRQPAPPDAVAAALARAEQATAALEDFPEAVHAIPLLSAMSEAALRRVLSTMLLKRLPAGAFVIREGEPGTSFYFVASGRLNVWATDGLGRKTPLAELGEGAVFGEMALLSAQPRSASVACATDADVFELGRASLAALADELGAVAEALHGFTRERLLGNLMATSPLFKPFQRMQQRDLLRRFTSHDVAPGTVVIHEGEEGRGLFVVLSGELEVSRRASDGAVPLGVLRTGDVFGEMALLRDVRTIATVIAQRPATVLFLAREYVARIVAAVPEIRKYLEALAEEREIDNQLVLGEEPAPADERILI